MSEKVCELNKKGSNGGTPKAVKCIGWERIPSRDSVTIDLDGDGIYYSAYIVGTAGSSVYTTGTTYDGTNAISTLATSLNGIFIKEGNTITKIFNNAWGTETITGSQYTLVSSSSLNNYCGLFKLV